MKNSPKISNGVKKIKFDWENILEMGKRIGIPRIKARAMLREYLQCQFLKFVYFQKNSRKLSFVGGTSLRILHNLDRFSEDLDFDNLNLTTKELNNLFKISAQKLEKIGFDNEFRFKKIRKGVWRGYLKFGRNILKEIGLSPFKEEKLMIKIEVMKPKFKTEQAVFLLNRFGALEHIVSNTFPVMLSQKSLAVLLRKPPRGRDFYDVVWILSRNIFPNFQTLKGAKIKTKDDYKEKMLKRYSQIASQLKDLKKQLSPFLVNEENIKYLDFFREIIKGL